MWNFHRFGHSGLVISFIKHTFRSDWAMEMEYGRYWRVILLLYGLLFSIKWASEFASLRVCEFDALRASCGVGRTVEAWPRHHVITLLLGFALHKAEDFIASFHNTQHTVCQPICLLLLLLLLPLSQRLAPAAMSLSGETTNNPHKW